MTTESIRRGRGAVLTWMGETTLFRRSNRFINRISSSDQANGQPLNRISVVVTKPSFS